MRRGKEALPAPRAKWQGLSRPCAAGSSSARWRRAEEVREGATRALGGTVVGAGCARGSLKRCGARAGGSEGLEQGPRAGGAGAQLPVGPTCGLAVSSLGVGPAPSSPPSHARTLGAVPGKSQGASGTSGCSWQRRCAAAISAAPCSSSWGRPLSEQQAPGETACDTEDDVRVAVRGQLRLPMVPAWDGATLLPSTRLLLKRREVAEVERALQSQREAFQQRMERLAQRRQQLSQREEQFRDVVLEFDEVLKASAARQERLLRRADEERAQAAGQGAKATRLRRELAGLLRRRERLAQRLRSLRGFGEYLQGVLPSMGQFQDVPDMLAHFGALAGVRAALAQRAGDGWEQLAQHRAQLRQYREEASSKLLCTNSELAQLRARLEAAHSDVLQGESCWAHIQSTAAQKTLLLGQVKLAVLHLFQLATARLSVGTDVALEDTEAQLDMVLLCMQDLAAICAELHPGQPAPRPHLPAAPRMP